MSEHPGIVGALVAFQSALPRVSKTAQAQYGAYADLAEVAATVLPRLASVGICYTARPTFDETGAPVLVAQLRHTSGEEITAEWRLTPAGPQQMGSQITYARRYCLLALSGVHPEGEDDDASEAQKEHAKLAKATVAAPKKATRSKTTRDEPDDPWAGLPPVTHTPPPAPKREQNRSTEPSREQRMKMFATLNDLGVSSQDEQRTLMGAILGRPVSTTKDFTRADITAVIDTLTDIAQQDDPGAAVAALLDVAPPLPPDPGAAPPEEEGPRPVVDLDTGGRT